MGFSQASIDFLKENRMWNSRTWFAEHKEQYQSVLLDPFKELVGNLGPAMLAIDPQIVTEPRVDRTLSRIYRDTRFSRDKSLYRDNMWLVFMRDKKQYGGFPGFYFDMNPFGFSYGMGYYQTSPGTMDGLRESVLRNGPLFQDAEDAYRSQTIFEMEGDSYKRTRYPEAGERQREWLDRKGISFNCHSGDMQLLFSDRLVELLLEGYHTLVPIYEFLCKISHQSTT